MDILDLIVGVRHAGRMIKKPAKGITIDSKNPKTKKASRVLRQTTPIPKGNNTIKPLRFFKKKR